MSVRVKNMTVTWESKSYFNFQRPHIDSKNFLFFLNVFILFFLFDKLLQLHTIVEEHDAKAVLSDEKNFPCYLFPKNVVNCSWTFPALQEGTEIFVSIRYFLTLHITTINIALMRMNIYKHECIFTLWVRSNVWNALSMHLCLIMQCLWWRNGDWICKVPGKKRINAFSCAWVWGLACDPSTQHKPAQQVRSLHLHISYGITW